MTWRSASAALVAGPEDQRYFELIERHQGVHQAQTAPPPAKTRLSTRHEGDLSHWEYGHAYRLVLSVTPESITGEIRDEDGKQFWRSTCTFGDAQAIRTGQPALTANGVESSLRDLVVEGVPSPSPDVLQVASGPRGNAAIVREILSRGTGAKRNIVLLNAAYGLAAAGKAADIPTGLKMAAESIDSGRAMEQLVKLAHMTNQ